MAVAGPDFAFLCASNMMCPSLATTREGQDLAALQREVLRSGQFILGPQVQALEGEFARLCGVGHAIAVTSGTDALSLILRAMGFSNGEVISSAHVPRVIRPW